MRVAAAPAIALVLAGLAGCTVGPDYARPAAPVSAAYKEGGNSGTAGQAGDAGWRRARPADAIDRGAWWSIYRDPVLDGLVRQIDITNENLKAAEANFRQAEAIVAEARAGFFPTVDLNAQAQRSRSSGANAGGVVSGQRIVNFFSTGEKATWTPDLWGQVRRTVEGDVASAQASAGDLAAARLSAQGTLASNYLQLRVADALQRLLDRSVKAYAESLRIARNQFTAGITSAADVAQAQTQLESTRAQAIAVGVTRAKLEHAIAVLIGKPPAELTIAPIDAVAAVPSAPAELPSALLERRPDIAAAERRMAAANAQIGVAETAFFPDITLSAGYGVQSSMLRKLFTDPSRVWSFGSALVDTLFDAGARQAKVQQARATYDASVATYRQTVLTGFQEVEDQLASLRIQADQAVAAEAAVAAAREAERIITNQYRAGTIAYTNVVVAQTAALANAQSALNVQQSRLVASVALIQALGGGWDAGQLPDRERIEADSPLDFSPLPPADAAPRWWLPASWF